MELYQNQDFAIKSGLHDNLLAKVFAWMFMGLFASGLIAYTTYSTGLINQLVNSNAFAVVLIIEVIAVLLFSLSLNKLSPSLAAILYFVYSAINGISLSTLFVSYNIDSILYVFFAASIMFAILAIYGYTTKKDLSKFSTIFFATLLVSIILGIINLFLGNSLFQTFIDIIVLLIFGGITAYDIQNIKAWAEYNPEKAHIFGAFQLYLDFINIFIRLLSLFGGRSRD